MKRRSDELQNLKADVGKKFGVKRVLMANEVELLDIIPTGIMALDYALGVGGWPRRHMCGVFGPPDVGKSSIMGMAAIRNAQALGLNAAVVSIERKFDAAWATKLGVDCDNLLMTRPAHGKEAFDMLQYLVESEAVDFILFDSIGGMLSETEMEIKGVAKQGGQAGLITWGMKRAAPAVFDNNVCVMMLNQVRDDMASRYAGVVKQPGGHGLEHTETVTIQLRFKSGAGSTYTITEHGEEVTIGRELVAVIKKNHLAEGTGQRATFNFYGKEVDGYPFGIDTVSDIINTGMRLGVIEKAGSYYQSPDGFRVQGQRGLEEHIRQHPNVVELIRNGVLAEMRKVATKPKLEVVDAVE